MIKFRKKIFKISGILLIALFMLALTGFVSNKIICRMDTDRVQGYYGKMIEVHGENMCVEVQGKGKEIIVLLPGWGTYSPILDFKPLVEQLKDDYTVVTIEYFGYGLSDWTDTPRTVENIADEIHTVLERLGYDRYVLMAHSISGIYGIYYAHEYPCEIEAFVGIDASFPEQTDEEEENMALMKGMADLGLYRLLTLGEKKGLMQNGVADDYTQEELTFNRKIALKNLLNKNICSEYGLRHENFEKTSGLLFDEDIPVLYFLSSESIAADATWETGRLKYMTNPYSELIKIDGGHYLHGQQAESVAQCFTEWYEQDR